MAATAIGVLVYRLRLTEGTFDVLLKNDGTIPTGNVQNEEDVRLAAIRNLRSLANVVDPGPFALKPLEQSNGRAIHPWAYCDPWPACWSETRANQVALCGMWFFRLDQARLKIESGLRPLLDDLVSKVDVALECNFHHNVVEPVSRLLERCLEEVWFSESERILALAQEAATALYHFPEATRRLTSPAGAKVSMASPLAEELRQKMGDVANSRKHGILYDPNRQITLQTAFAYEMNERKQFRFLRTEVWARNQRWGRFELVDAIIAFMGQLRCEFVIHQPFLMPFVLHIPWDVIDVPAHVRRSSIRIYHKSCGLAFSVSWRTGPSKMRHKCSCPRGQKEMRVGSVSSLPEVDMGGRIVSTCPNLVRSHDRPSTVSLLFNR
jgi:predicted NUDIX family NTP pyrophosphohydrolase